MGLKTVYTNDVKMGMESKLQLFNPPRKYETKTAPWHWAALQRKLAVNLAHSEGQLQLFFIFAALGHCYFFTHHFRGFPLKLCIYRSSACNFNFLLSKQALISGA